MPVKRRLLGGVIAGLGEGLQNYGVSRIKRRQLEEDRQRDWQMEMQKLRLKSVVDLSEKLGANPNAYESLLGGASINPLLQGLDLSILKPSDSVLMKPLEKQIATAKAPEDIPVDIGGAASSLGVQMPSVPQSNAAAFGAQADFADAPPELNRLLNTASARQGQITEARERDIRDVGQKKYAESYGTTAGGNRADNENFPNVLSQEGQKGDQSNSQRVALETSLNPVMASRAGAEAAAREAAQAKADAERYGLSPEQATIANNLAQGYRQESQNFRIREDSFRTVLAGAKEPSAAGDLSLLYAYMRLLDPASSVREGEFATAQNAVGVPAQIRNYYNRIQSGERLGTEQRADFVRQAFNNYGAAVEGQKRVNADYLKRAETARVPAEMVVRPLDEELSKAPPKAGSTLDRLLQTPTQGAPLTPVERR